MVPPSFHATQPLPHPQANLVRSKVQRHGGFRRRYFVLDHNDLRYYTDSSLAEYSGHVDLGTVTEVCESTIPNTPPNALDLVTDARVFTLVPATRELMEEWRHRLTAVVRVPPSASPKPPHVLRSTAFSVPVPVPVPVSSPKHVAEA